MPPRLVAHLVSSLRDGSKGKGSIQDPSQGLSGKGRTNKAVSLTGDAEISPKSIARAEQYALDGDGLEAVNMLGTVLVIP
jgi:hypothetical protein